MQASEIAGVKLRKEIDPFSRKGVQISAYVSIPGAIIAATGDSMKAALAMLADALHENDQPFWEEGDD